MATALQYLAENPAIRKEMGENGRRLVEQRYDVRKSVNAYLELYRAAVS
jgi:glycosyltransferase involved in cell wall biosynthesis